MEREVHWLYAPCVVLVLKFLTIMPRTPMQLRILTDIQGNYVNVILKKLESEGIVGCLTYKEKIGKVFCIKPESRDLVEKVLKESGYNLKVRYLPELKWKAYGRLNCKTCKQIRKVFDKALKLRKENMAVTEPALEGEMKNKDGVLEMDRSDVYRALRKLKALGVLFPVKKKRKPLEYKFTQKGLELAEFMSF